MNKDCKKKTHKLVHEKKRQIMQETLDFLTEEVAKIKLKKQVA